MMLESEPGGEKQPNEPQNGNGQLEPFVLVPEPKPRYGFARLGIDRVLSRHILRIALPVVLGMLTQTAINILDTVMVGRLPLEIANPGQAAIQNSLPLMWLVGGFLSAVWVGTQAITSRRAGEGKDDLAGRALTNSLLISSTAGTLLVFGSIIVVPDVIQALYSDPKVVELAVSYLQIRLVGVLAMACTFSYKSFFDGIGKTKVFMTVAVLMNILNVVLNFLLIYGNETLGVPMLGVAGAALASVISAYVGLAMLIFISFAPRFLLRYRYYDPRKLNGWVIREIVRLSLPNGAATVVVMAGFEAFYWVVGQVNDRYAEVGNPVISTANAVIIAIFMITFMSALAFGMATAALVSQSLGAGRPYLGERYALDAAKMWAYVMWVLGAIMILIPDVILGLINPDPEVIALAHTPLQMIGVLQGVVAIAMILAQTLYGVGLAKFVLLVELVLHLLVVSPVAYLFGVVLDYGLVGVYVGPILYACFLAVAMYLKFKQGDWKEVLI
ncbi:MATE family efflux transporter [Myxococcota bacterium]